MIPAFSGFDSGFDAGFFQGGITRLGVSAIPRCLYGTFAGKVEQIIVVEDVTKGGGPGTARQMRKLEREQLMAMRRRDDEEIVALLAALRRR